MMGYKAGGRRRRPWGKINIWRKTAEEVKESSCREMGALKINK